MLLFLTDAVRANLKIAITVRGILTPQDVRVLSESMTRVSGSYSSNSNRELRGSVDGELKGSGFEESLFVWQLGELTKEEAAYLVTRCLNEEPTFKEASPSP